MKPKAIIRSLIVVALVLAAGGAVAKPSAAATATSGNLRLLYFAGDAIRNYDFTDQIVASNKVDWAVSLLFYNNAEINKVKNALGGQGFTITGSSENGRLSDDGGATFVWDTDGGRKRGDCTAYTHFRIYADADDRMYTPSMGYYLFGSTHQDWYECYFDARFGYSETAEQQVNSAAVSAFGVANRYDYANFYNYEAYREESNHIWDDDGWASYVFVP
jgi:hypothetical protein